MKPNQYLAERASEYLEKFCIKIDSRRVGGEGNREAAAFFGDICASFGFETERLDFECIDWKAGPVLLKAGRDGFEAHPSPYSLGWSGSAPLSAAANIKELEQVDTLGKLLF